MFGSSKSGKGVPPRIPPTGFATPDLRPQNQVGLDSTAASSAGLRPAGLEPAKREMIVDDLALEQPDPLAERRAHVAKYGFNFAAKPKPQPSTPAEKVPHLYVGRAIKLKGEIAECDLLKVDGVFEGIARTRQLSLCADGTFIGTATVEEAEIEGVFEGDLTVRGRLFLRAKGRIRGNFSFGVLEVERGGKIDGHINPLEISSDAAASPKTPEFSINPAEAGPAMPMLTPIVQPLNGSRAQVIGRLHAQTYGQRNRPAGSQTGDAPPTAAE